ncbi:hypothetical protein BH10PAT1_BH10PAT1_2990 [soil metagenome]
MIILILIVISSLFYLPIIINPSILLARGNDLTIFFWPMIYFVKNIILTNHQLPLWNNLFFSGTPLLPDPQAPIFYLPNIIFLLFKNIDTGFFVSTYIHILVSSIGMYLLGRYGFKFSKKVSLFCSILYIFSPKLSGYIEAGHIGLINSWSWLPFAFLYTLLLSKKPSIKNSLFLAGFLALIFYTHVLIFIITVIAISILYLYFNKNIFYLFITGIFCFGFIAIAFLPQFSWQNQSTRNLLLNSPDVYPKWMSITEFIKASFSPIIFGPNFIQNLDTEKVIGIGFFVSLLSFIGFLKLKLKHKILFLVTTSTIVIISLNNLSPVYNILIKQNWYILLRVSTRFWFLLIYISIFLAGVGLENLFKLKKIKFLVYTVAFLTCLELLLTSWTKILKPIPQDSNYAPKSVYEFLSQDKSRFRVFCLERCLSQRIAPTYGLELADGYGTLQQMNYYIYSEQLSQSFYRNRYTLSIPPFEIFEYEKLQPYSPNLAAFNIKYVISNHVLSDKNLKLTKQFGNYLIYINEINLPRANYPITIYTPNFIKLDTSTYKDSTVTLSEVYNTDWQAFSNGTKEIKITETPDKTRQVMIDKNTKFINFVYRPESFLIGLSITIITVGGLIIFFIFRTFKKKK